MLAKISGYKTYVGFIVVALYAALIQMQIVESNEALWGLIALWTGVSLRMAVTK